VIWACPALNREVDTLKEPLAEPLAIVMLAGTLAILT
jgi:hypothetical protein